VLDGSLLMVDLPGGRFLMGSPDSDDLARDDEKPQHEVTISPFRIAITPVTMELYREVMLLRSAFRFDGGGPVYRYKFNGFRCVRGSAPAG
jgi:formylglycine-generating enzyme required for sulfatase activity